MSDDLLSRLGKVAREEDAAAHALEAEQDDVSALLRAQVLAQATRQLKPKAPPDVKRSRWPMPMLVGALGVAAALVLLWLRPEPEPLPPYALSMTGNLEEMRGPVQAEVLRFAPGSQFELVMRPADDVRADVELRLWLEQAGRGRRLSALAQRSETGTFRIVMRAKDLLSSVPGRSRLTVFVCLPEHCGAREQSLRQHLPLPLGQAAQREIEYLP